MNFKPLVFVYYNIFMWHVAQTFSQRNTISAVEEEKEKKKINLKMKWKIEKKLHESSFLNISYFYFILFRAFTRSYVCKAVINNFPKNLQKSCE